jgi:hypothetical protein
VTSILDNARAYVAACSQSRLDALLPKLQHLDMKEVTVAQEPRKIKCRKSGIVFDACSNRFRHQMAAGVHRPLVWIEDDADIPENFRTLWAPYEKSLPADWKIAVIGWGVISAIGRKTAWAPVNDLWCHVDGPFWGTHCVLFNSGQWRHKLAREIFFADSGLHVAMKNAGLNTKEKYHTRSILIGTCDRHNVHGRPVIGHRTGGPILWAERTQKTGMVRRFPVEGM